MSNEQQVVIDAKEFGYDSIRYFIEFLIELGFSVTYKEEGKTITGIKSTL